MDDQVKIQIDIRQRIQNAYNNYKKSPKDRIREAYLQARIESLDQIWAGFVVNHEAMVIKAEFVTSTYYKNNVYDETEELYFEYKSELKHMLSTFTRNKNSDVVPGNSGNSTENKCQQFNLPKITIPKFSGDYLEFQSFKDLFLSLIHNNDAIEKVQKMHYLKSSLVGEAEQLVKHIPVSESNYDRCWNQLESRYNNKRYLSHCILKRLLSQKNIVGESANALKHLLDTTTECLEALGNLGIPVNTWDLIVIHLMTLKLDTESKRQWELNIANSSATDSLPTFEQFKEFIGNRYRALEFIETKTVPKPQGNNSRPKALHVMTNACCQFCSENHRIAFCKKFSAENVESRRKFVQENRLCFNCLGANHSANSCQSKTTCRICKRHHHSLLHPKGTIGTGIAGISGTAVASGSTSNVDSRTASDSAAAEQSSPQVVSCFSSGRDLKQILLATALVGVETKRGIQTIRALLDQGSQASFITEATVQFLGLPKIPIKGVISGIGGDSKLCSKSMVEIKIHSIFDRNVVIKVDAYVLKSITSFLPSKIVSLEWEELDNLQLADPKFNTPNKINILLGAEVYGRVIRDGVKRSPSGTPVAQATALGWIVSGAVKNSPEATANVVVMHACVEENNTLKKFWELQSDSAIKPNQMLTADELQCEKIFAETTRRDSEGRYVVQLPFREPEESRVMPTHSREIAEKRLLALESRLRKDENLKLEYKKVMNEYLDMGHMELVPEPEKDNLNAVYLPHHAVVRSDKDTTKVRVVFDASCKGKNGISLNNTLLIGPTLQLELRHIILRWRVFPICMSADIVKMYRQVKVDERHADFQRVMWRDDEASEIKDYRLLRVTFGTASAPYLAVKALQQVAHDEGKNGNYSSVTEKVKTDYYMDDLMTGAETEEEGVKVYEEMNALLQKGGFILQKWTSNNTKLMEILRNIEKDGGKEKESGDGLNLKMDSTIKILGLTWCRDEDSFKYVVKLTPPRIPATKRSIISDISRLFDPLGWVAPCIIVAKIMIQKLWLAGVDWDEEVPEHIIKEWFTYRQELIELNQISLPRWFRTHSSDKLVELHGFCDASKSAYAAVVYLRVVDQEENIQVALVTAKTKVAPIKQVSIPRLELCGAVLLTRLLVEVAEILHIGKQNLHAWTDSTVVLAWINSHPSRWQTFVANRVAEIVTTLDPCQWSHVVSKKNPADCASRGTRPSELLETAIWFSGPEFLKDEVITYVKSKKENTTELEMVKSHCSTVETPILDRFSTLAKLVRVIAYCRRVQKWKGPPVERPTYLTSQELVDALDCCIRLCQQEHFKSEIDKLQQKKAVDKKSKIHNLNPFLDNKNILRVSGRLEFSNLNLSQKHPILLPKCHLTNLIILNTHKETLHGGLQLMLNFLRSKYWILGAKQMIKSHIRKCVTCLRYAKIAQPPLMGQLPSARVTPTRPFLNSGVDYAGPISLRSARGRGHHAYKGYICLFVCMSTKAVHIEAVSDLTTQGFLHAFKRFVARRGHCENLWSDNGTNFLGASNELKRLFQVEKEDITAEVAEALANNRTQWHFIPPRSPNFGGLWEAGIKSVKQHLRRVIGNTTLTYEEMSTVLCQIEACLNSRPLTRIDNENDTVTVLTPGHFLTGDALVTAPDYNFESSNVSSLRRWQHTQKMLQDFWRRWFQEYLSQFYQRYRWSRHTPEPKIGDVVLVREDDLPPSRWLYGRIMQKHTGKDDITRVVTLRIKDSIIKRPISKLIVLPVTS